jgi:hypothetical protein
LEFTISFQSISKYIAVNGFDGSDISENNSSNIMIPLKNESNGYAMLPLSQQNMTKEK